MQQSFGYILNQRPFRDNSVLVDIFTEDYGRICCVARPAKKRGKILKGSLEQFRYLKLQWLGKGNVQTLIDADERGRHNIPASEMMVGLYLNELILLFTTQHNPQADLFSAYKYTLHKLSDPLVNRQVLMRFELYLLTTLGYPFDTYIPLSSSNAKSNTRYIFREEDGFISEDLMSSELLTLSAQNIYISSDLLLAIQNIQSMQKSHWVELRSFLDRVLSQLAPRPIKARKLLSL